MKQALVHLLNRKVRLYLYGICVAISLYLTYKGVVESEELMYLNGIFVAVFGLAAINVPTRDAVDPPPSSVADKALDTPS